VPLPPTITWVVVANAGRARVFEERRHGSPLHERLEWERSPTDADRRHATREKAILPSRFGPRRSVVNEYDFAEEAERRFLDRLAGDLRHAEDRYEQLVLIAPPRALGVLRLALARFATRRIERADARDCVETDADALRTRLRELRLPP
jgi:protein required for attachment to host cells